MRVALAFAIFTFGIGLIGSGCEEDEVFPTCPLGQTIIKICEENAEATGQGQGADLTCVVDDHPQCPDSVCLSWKGGESRCTRRCDIASPNCPDGSKCMAFVQGSEKHYCVQDEFLVEDRLTN